MPRIQRQAFIAVLVVATLLLVGLLLAAGRPTAAQAALDSNRTPVWSTQTAVAATQAAGATQTAAAPSHAPFSVGILHLTAAGAPVGAWTVVEWGNDEDGWHVVEGWQGELDAAETKTWWVLPKDFDTGPFRWVVYTRRGGVIWGISAAFRLPASADQPVQVVVTAAK